MVKVSGHLVLPTISYGSFSKEGSEFTKNGQTVLKEELKGQFQIVLSK